MTKRFSQQQKYHDRMYSDTSSLNAHSRLICWDYSPSVAHLAPSLSLLPFSLVYERLCFSLLTCVIPCVRFGLVSCNVYMSYVKLAFKSEVKRSTLTVLHPITHSHIYCTGQTVPVCFFHIFPITLVVNQWFSFSFSFSFFLNKHVFLQMLRSQLSCRILHSPTSIYPIKLRLYFIHSGKCFGHFGNWFFCAMWTKIDGKCYKISIFHPISANFLPLSRCYNFSVLVQPFSIKKNWYDLAGYFCLVDASESILLYL